jgi:multidrug efflux pump subunit AcrB
VLGLSLFIGRQNKVFWFALAVGAIGGLLVSSLFSFIILPTVMLTKNNLGDT